MDNTVFLIHLIVIYIIMQTYFPLLITAGIKLPALNGQKTTCECGKPGNQYSRIINGLPVDMEGPFSSMVQFINKEKQRMPCDGFLITPRHVLGAAHCLRMKNADELEAVVGNPNYEFLAGKTTEFTQKVDIQEIVIDNYSNATGKYNDIAVVVLAKPVQFNKMVGVACLPKDDSVDLSNESARIAGWGFTRNDSTTLSKVLREARVKILSPESCHQAWNVVPVENPKQICVNSPFQRAAEGDSGSPVMWYDESIRRYVAVGIVSFGLPNPAKPYPRVNTYIPKYLDFIKSVVKRTSEEKICTKV